MTYSYSLRRLRTLTTFTFLTTASGAAVLAIALPRGLRWPWLVIYAGSASLAADGHGLEPPADGMGADPDGVAGHEGGGGAGVDFDEEAA